MTLSNDRLKLIDKIIKLLALADGTNHTEEAETAKRLAAELMAKYNVSLSETTIKDEFQTFEKVMTTKTVERFDCDLIWAIARFNGCTCIRHMDGYNKVRFVYAGRPQDIEAAIYMLDVVTQQRKVAYDAHSAQYIRRFGKAQWNNDWTDWRGFMNGFTMGVDSKLRELSKMSDKKVQEWGLVPVDSSKLALAWYNENVSKTKTAGGRMQGGSNAGFEAGKSVSIHKGVGAQSSTKRIS